MFRFCSSSLDIFSIPTLVNTCYHPPSPVSVHFSYLPTMSSSFLCCAPINASEQAMINMDLDEIWEIHKNGNGVSDVVIVSQNKARGKKKNMNPGRNVPKSSMGNVRRVNDDSNGWLSDGADYEEREWDDVGSVRGKSQKNNKSKGRYGKGKNKKNRNERGRGERDNKMVSISKYVEKIELQKRSPSVEPKTRNIPITVRRDRSRSVTRGGSGRDLGMARSRSVSMERGRMPSRGGIDRNRSRSMSMERGRGMMRNRSRSLERKIMRNNRSRSMERGMNRNRSRSKNRFFN